MLVYVTRKNGAFFQDYGRVIHDQAIYGVEPEGKVKVDWHYETFSFPDGDTYELARPTYTITDWYKGRSRQKTYSALSGYRSATLAWGR